MKLRAALKGWLKQPMFSPAGLVVRAGMLALIYGVVSLLGFRESMSMLSLTFPEGSSVGWSLFTGMVYLICYFLWLLAVPILLIAAGFMAVVNLILPSPGEGKGGDPSA